MVEKCQKTWVFSFKNELIILVFKTKKNVFDTKNACHMTIFEQYSNMEESGSISELQLTALKFWYLHDLTQQYYWLGSIPYAGTSLIYKFPQTKNKYFQ